eukprot:4977377-Amphidinium_carterae.1
MGRGNRRFPASKKPLAQPLSALVGHVLLPKPRAGAALPLDQLYGQLHKRAQNLQFPVVHQLLFRRSWVLRKPSNAGSSALPCRQTSC